MDVEVRPLAERDVPEADRIFRLAFGTFLGMPDPMAFAGDASMVATRWRADPAAALGAYRGGELVGSNFAARWGSFAFFGPLTVRPDLWNQGVAQRLLAPTMALFERWGVRQTGLFTFPDSRKHHALYRKCGFEVQARIPLMRKAVASGASGDAGGWTKFSALDADARAAALADCRGLADALLTGLDLEREIRAVAEQGIGDTLLLRKNGALAGFAVCHMRAGSEAGSGTLYVKFGAAQPGRDAPARFVRLLAAVEALAASHGLAQLSAGTNAARADALALLREAGFEIEREGVAMQRPNEAGFNRPDCFVIDDWR